MHKCKSLQPQSLRVAPFLSMQVEPLIGPGAGDISAAMEAYSSEVGLTLSVPSESPPGTLGVWLCCSLSIHAYSCRTQKGPPSQRE